MAGPKLESGVTYDRLPPSTLMQTLRPGDRLIYSGRTFEVTAPTTFSPSGKTYHSRWRIVAYTGTSPYMKRWFANPESRKEFAGSGRLTTMANRVVYRPSPDHYFQHYIEEW